MTNKTDHEAIISEIRDLADRNNTLILAHNYQPPEIYRIADQIGDSLELARSAQQSSADTILFCGVDFMAETAKILSPEARVLIPDPRARCTMAHMAGVKEAEILKREHPDATVVSYVNTTTETKAITDICCTSANAVEIVQSCDTNTVIFLPDRNLAAYVQRFSAKKIIPAGGFCYVHDAVTPESVSAMKNLHPGTPFIAHPECRPGIIDMADAVCSTSGMISYCRESPATSFIIGTEAGMLNRLRQEIPEKKFFSVAGFCEPMKRVTLEKVRDSLLTGSGEVTIGKGLMDAARLPLERMIDRSGRKNRQKMPV
jgi:quinolinate synthase